MKKFLLLFIACLMSITSWARDYYEVVGGSFASGSVTLKITCPGVSTLSLDGGYVYLVHDAGDVFKSAISTQVDGNTITLVYNAPNQTNNDDYYLIASKLTKDGVSSQYVYFYLPPYAEIVEGSLTDGGDVFVKMTFPPTNSYIYNYVETWKPLYLYKGEELLSSQTNKYLVTIDGNSITVPFYCDPQANGNTSGCYVKISEDAFKFNNIFCDEFTVAFKPSNGEGGGDGGDGDDDDDDNADLPSLTYTTQGSYWTNSDIKFYNFECGEGDKLRFDVGYTSPDPDFESGWASIAVYIDDALIGNYSWCNRTLESAPLSAGPHTMRVEFIEQDLIAGMELFARNIKLVHPGNSNYYLDISKASEITYQSPYDAETVSYTYKATFEEGDTFRFNYTASLPYQNLTCLVFLDDDVLFDIRESTPEWVAMPFETRDILPGDHTIEFRFVSAGGGGEEINIFNIEQVSLYTKIIDSLDLTYNSRQDGGLHEFSFNIDEENEEYLTFDYNIEINANLTSAYRSTLTTIIDGYPYDSWNATTSGTFEMHDLASGRHILSLELLSQYRGGAIDYFNISNLCVKPLYVLADLDNYILSLQADIARYTATARPTTLRAANELLDRMKAIRDEKGVKSREIHELINECNQMQIDLQFLYGDYYADGKFDARDIQQFAKKITDSKYMYDDEYDTNGDYRFTIGDLTRWIKKLQDAQ